MLQAVILAAGFGSRLRPLTDDRPKALVPIDGHPLLERALDALAEAGVKSVVVVTGYRQERVRELLAWYSGLDVTTVENPDYATTNTLASLLHAAPLLDDDFLLLDGDLVFEPAVLRPLVEARGEPVTRIAIDRSRPLDDDAVKVSVADGRVTAVAKVVAPGAIPIAESIGMARIDWGMAPALFAVGRTLLEKGVRQAYYEAAFERLIADGLRFETADVTGLRWVEIDDHDDLQRAHALFAR